MLDSLVVAGLSWLNGSPSKVTYDPAYHAEQQRIAHGRIWAMENGWHMWEATSPYAHEKVWIWRPEWNTPPKECTIRDMDPMMNVWGLFWKPWRANEDSDFVPKQIASDI